MLFPILWMPIAYSIRELSTRFRTIGGCCSTCLDYLGEVLWECKVRLTEDPDDNFDDFAAVINFITGVPDRGELPVDAYMDYTTESTYSEEKRLFYEQSSHPTHKDDEDERCPICLVDFECNAPITELNCSHFYHSTCAKRWFENNWFCPMCRADIRYTLYPRRRGEPRHYWVL